MGIKAFTNFHIDEDKPESPDAEYVQYKVIRGDVINCFKLERGGLEAIDISNYKPDLANLGFTFTFDNSRTFTSKDVKDEEIIKEYNDNLINLMKKENPNVAEIKVFDHTIRCDTADDMKRAEDLNAVPEDAEYRPVALYAHVDYTEESARDKLSNVLSNEEFASWTEGHWGIVNMWRPLDLPVQRTPLAFIDPNSVKPEDRLVKKLNLPGRTGKITGFLKRDYYRWVMVDKMETNRVWIFTQYDTGSIPWVPHSALDLPGTENAPPRRSIESRMCVRYHK